jgi:hypothetical protein
MSDYDQYYDAIKNDCDNISEKYCREINRITYAVLKTNLTQEEMEKLIFDMTCNILERVSSALMPHFVDKDLLESALNIIASKAYIRHLNNRERLKIFCETIPEEIHSDFVRFLREGENLR